LGYDKVVNTSQFLAILYADIFDFPLKGDELKRWELRTKDLEPRTKDLKLIKRKEDFYFLKEKEKIVEFRKKREKCSENKIRLARKIAGLLKIIPTIKMVGITGALAVKNADLDDDIDFLIVTSAKALWRTRLLTTLLVELTGKRRHPYDKNFKDKVCLNMFIDENHLAVPKRERNIYTAHEVAQLKPLWERDSTYLKFLSANSWVKNYLPNAIGEFRTKDLGLRTKLKTNNYFLLLEKFFKNFQLWYMRKRKTTEKISDVQIMFHPEDKTRWVLKEYYQRIDKYIKS